MQVVGFDEVLTALTERDKASLLLGNGFSMGFDKDIFNYGPLFDAEPFSELNSEINKVAALRSSKDFELVMRAIQDAEQVGRIFGLDDANADPRILQNLHRARSVLSNELSNRLAKRHPDAKHSVLGECLSACQQFLRPFGQIFTINYDLLLYWAILHEDWYKSHRHLKDGFGGHGVLLWPSLNTEAQTIHYIHGALHLFAQPDHIEKVRATGRGVMMQDIRQRLQSGNPPLVVTDGAADGKRQKIFSSPYLQHCYQRLVEASGTLVAFGFGFKSNDQHILDAISTGRLSRLFVGVFGDPTSADLELIRNVDSISRSRMRLARPARGRQALRPPLSVSYFDSSKVCVWGSGRYRTVDRMMEGIAESARRIRSRSAD